MPRLRTLIATLALLAPVTAVAAPDLDRSGQIQYASSALRVRPHDARSAALLLDGLRQSETLRTLVRRLEDRNVIVYIQMETKLKGRLAGSLTWLTGTQKFRYVRVSINPDLRGAVAVAVLGHELQHALEVADEPSIVDRKSLNAFYRAHGISMRVSTDGWDTRAAQEVGEEIRREVATARSGYGLDSVQGFDPRQWH